MTRSPTIPTTTTKIITKIFTNTKGNNKRKRLGAKHYTVPRKITATLIFFQSTVNYNNIFKRYKVKHHP